MFNQVHLKVITSRLAKQNRVGITLKHFFQWSGFACMAITSGMAFSDTVCDSTLNPVTNELLAYRQRDNDKICEGFYRSKVSVDNLDVVGLSLDRLRFDSSQSRPLRISAPFINNQIVKVRAVGIPLKTYYRLDAQLAPGETLLWHLQDVLARKKIRGSKIGLYGQLAEDPEVYVPLAIDDQVTGDIVLTLRASIDIANVSWRSADFRKGRCTKPNAWQDLSSPRGFRGGQGIDISLPSGKNRQLCVEVAAKPKKSSDWLKKAIRVQLGSAK